MISSSFSVESKPLNSFIFNGLIERRSGKVLPKCATNSEKTCLKFFLNIPVLNVLLIFGSLGCRKIKNTDITRG